MLAAAPRPAGCGHRRAAASLRHDRRTSGARPADAGRCRRHARGTSARYSPSTSSVERNICSELLDIVARRRAIAHEIARHDARSPECSATRKHIRRSSAPCARRARSVGIVAAGPLEGVAAHQQRGAVADPVGGAQALHRLALDQRLRPERHHAIVLVDAGEPAIGEADRRAALTERVELELDLGRRPQIVGVDEGEICRRGRRRACVARRRHAGIVLPDQPHAAILADLLVDDRDRPSVAPSSMTTMSSSGWVCRPMLSRVAAIVRSALRIGTTTPTMSSSCWLTTGQPIQGGP